MMKNVSDRETSGAAHIIHAVPRSALGVFQRAACLGLLGLVAGISQTAFAEEPSEIFLKICASCHGKDGKAQTPAAKKLGVKDLSQSKLTDAQIVQQIMEGKQAGQESSKMPAFKEKLTPEEVQSLVPVVKEFRK